MNGKKITAMVSIIFYLVMIILSINVRKIHTASLPRVTVGNLEGEKFASKEGDTDDESSPIEFSVGIPKVLYDHGKVYVIVKEMVNGEDRVIAREVTDLVISRDNGTHYEVISGISGIDLVVMSGQQLIYNGCEVYVEGENNILDRLY